MTEIEARKAKPGEKRYSIYDSGGLYLDVLVSGTKTWRVRCWIDGKAKIVTLGKYPGMSLREARNARDEAKRKVARAPQRGLATFQEVADEWLRIKVLPHRAPGTARNAQYRLERYVFPVFGDKPINSISPVSVLQVVREIEGAGHIDLAHRVVSLISRVFRYGVATGKAERDVSADLRGALQPLKHTHHASIVDPGEIGGLMRAIDGMVGSASVRCGLLFLAFTFVRPGELRGAQWSEVDFEDSLWRIPPERMKIKRPHLVPLSSQALEILRCMRPVSGHGQLIFPSIRSLSKPLSENTFNAALRRLGYGHNEMVSHGFRSMASTILNEHQWPPDAIERQLAHLEGNSVRAAYNYAEHMETRREMIQWWGDWLREQQHKG